MFYLDHGFGESRGVITLAGRPERLIVARDDDPAEQSLGARVAGRINSVQRALAVAFIDLGGGPEGVLNLTPDLTPVVEGGWVEVQVKSQARAGKGPVLRLLGPAEGPVRLLSPGPNLDERVKALAGGEPVHTGSSARAIADLAQDEALETQFPLPGGGSIAVETTRALTAVDVDLGGRAGEGAKRVARAANLAALAEAARVLRLKGLGGLVVIDLAGRGHDAPVLLTAARAAFAADNPGVAFGGVSRFGAMELTIPRRARPVGEILCGSDGASTAVTLAMKAVRALQREAAADRGGRFEALTSTAVEEAARPALAMLIGQVGARVGVCGASGRTDFEIVRR